MTCMHCQLATENPAAKRRALGTMAEKSRLCETDRHLRVGEILASKTTTERRAMKFMKTSYAMHSESMRHLVATAEGRQWASHCLAEQTSADQWRHDRQYDLCDCLADKADASWLTIGDGRFGLDAIRLKERGVKNILPTDIAMDALAAAKEKGLIDDFRVENAECLSFADDSFDYVFCKESFHHFPLPMIAVYEMLRVARKGVFLVGDPNDAPPLGVVPPSLRWISRPMRRFLNAALSLRFSELPNAFRKQPLTTATYEDGGNYVYHVSARELEKVALALNFPQIAVKCINDHYIHGAETEPASMLKSRKYRTIRYTVAKKDFLSLINIRPPDLVMAGLFKQSLDKRSLKSFKTAGWKVYDLPRNPHAQTGDPAPENQW